MKTCIIFIYLMIAAFQSFAQQGDEKLLYAAKAEKYKNMKNVGTVLTVLGSISMIVAAAHIEQDYSYYSEDYNTGDKFAMAGVVFLGAGIPLWIVGARSHDKYNQKLKEVSIHVNMNSQNRGLTLKYRF